MARDESRGVTDYPRKLDDNSEILGIDSKGDVVYWDPVREVTLGGDLGPDEDRAQLDVRRELGMDEDLADLIEDVEQSVGWDELSERARGLLGGDSEN
ncbi:MAG: hypothetical protein ABEJ90_01555 [Halobacterium sp.]